MSSSVLNILRWFAIILLMSISSVYAKDRYIGMSIGDGNYEEVLKRSTFSLVNFYKEGCYYCDQLEPTYKLLSEAFLGTGLQILSVNIKENPRVQSIENIQGFPTLKLYDNRVRRYVENYRGNRDLDNLIHFLTTTTSVEPKLPELEYIQIESLEELNQIEAQLQKEEDKSTLIAFVAPWLAEWSLHFSTYTKLLKQMNPDVKLIIVDGSIGATTEIIRHYKVDKFPTFIFRHDLNQQGFKFMDTQKGLNIEVLNAFMNNGLGEWFNDVKELSESRLNGPTINNNNNKNNKGSQIMDEPGRKYKLNFGDGDKETDDEEIDRLFYRLRDL